MTDNVIEMYRKICIENLRESEKDFLHVFYAVSGVPKKYQRVADTAIIANDVYWNTCNSLKNNAMKPGKGLYIEGKGFTGKSMACCNMVKSYFEGKNIHPVCLANYNTGIWWWDYMDLAEKIRRYDNSWQDFIEYTFTLKLLVIDDFGRDYKRGSEGDDFIPTTITRLCKKFLENDGHLIINSNLSFDKVNEMYTKKLGMLFKEHLTVVKFENVYQIAS